MCGAGVGVEGVDGGGFVSAEDSAWFLLGGGMGGGMGGGAGEEGVVYYSIDVEV